MTRTAEVVVVGSGIIGASIAYQLARHGVGNVIALDKGKGPSEGSTGASSSVIRCKYSNPQVVRLAFHGQESYGNWTEFTGLTEPRSGLQQLGVLWMMGHSTSDVEADAAMLVSQGVSARAIGPDEVGSMFPALSDCGARLDFEDPDSHVCVPGDAFLFETDGGHADPVGANQDLIEAARRLEVEVDFNSTVTSVLNEHGRVTGVRLADGSEISAGLVINASGPWCNQLNQMAGADLRWTLSPIRAQIVYTTWPADLGPLPVAGDNSTGIYFRPQSGGQQVLIGSFLQEDEEEVIDDPDDFKKVPDADFIEMKLAAFQHRVPSLAVRGQVSGVAGLYTMNREDVHPVVGPSGVDGFWVANGFSGHGFKLAPAVGSMVAQAFTGETMDFDTDVPMEFFSVDREPIDVAVKNVLA
jgi:glycine/D-amino acid oxidase-like deaminating enzyme